jgi:hypothetical protein
VLICEKLGCICIIGVLSYCNIIWGRRGRDRMLVEFTTVYAITTKFVRSKNAKRNFYLQRL